MRVMSRVGDEERVGIQVMIPWEDVERMEMVDKIMGFKTSKITQSHVNMYRFIGMGEGVVQQIIEWEREINFNPDLH